MDDPTRIFRAVRFEQRFKGRMEAGTQKWLRKAVEGNFIRRVSGERLRNEFRLIFKEPRPERAVLRLGELKILPRVHPALGLSRETSKILPQIARAIQVFRDRKVPLEDEGMVWFQSLLLKMAPRDATSLSKRLMLSRVEQTVVAQRQKIRAAILPEMSRQYPAPSHVHRLLSPLRPEVTCFLLAEACPYLRRKMSEYLDTIRRAKPWVRGRDLKILGIPPGFRYSFILLEAFNRQLDGKLASRRAALSWVKKTYAP